MTVTIMKQRKDIKMTKLIYPSNNVYGYVSGDISYCKTNMLNALNNCSFQIPNGFAYTNFVNSLYSTVDSYRKEIDDIQEKIKHTDIKLENFSDNLSRKINSTPTSIIEEKSGLIKF